LGDGFNLVTPALRHSQPVARNGYNLVTPALRHSQPVGRWLQSGNTCSVVFTTSWGDGCYPTCRQLAGIYLEVSNLAVTNLAVTNLAVTNLAVINLAVINLAVTNLAVINLAAINLAAIDLAAIDLAAINLAAIDLAAIKPCHQGLQNNSAFALRPPGKCTIQHCETHS
jgi:hypothetical protein